MLILTTASHMPANDDGTYKTEEDINTALETYNFIFFKEELLCNVDSPVPDSEILTFTGAKLLALYSDTKSHINGQLLETDIALLELETPNLDTQPLAKNLYFAGWNVRPRGSYQFSSEDDSDDEAQPPINQDTEIGVGGLVIGHPRENNGSYYKKVAIINNAIKERPVQWVAGGILITEAIVDEDEMNHYIFDDPDGFHSINIFNRPFIEMNSAYGSPWFNKYGEVAAIYSTHKPHIPASVGTFSIATALSAVWNKGEKPLRDFLSPNSLDNEHGYGGNYCEEGVIGVNIPYKNLDFSGVILEDEESEYATAQNIFARNFKINDGSSFDANASSFSFEEGTTFEKGSEVDLKNLEASSSDQCVMACYEIDSSSGRVSVNDESEVILVNVSNAISANIVFTSSTSGILPNEIRDIGTLMEDNIVLFDLQDPDIRKVLADGYSTVNLTFDITLINQCDEKMVNSNTITISNDDYAIDSDYLPYALELTGFPVASYVNNKRALAQDYRISSSQLPQNWTRPEDVDFEVAKSERLKFATAYDALGRFRANANDENMGKRKELRKARHESSEWFPDNKQFGTLYQEIYYPVPISTNIDDIAALPIIIYMTGGGFLNLGAKPLIDATCKWLAQKGYIVVNIDYRTGIVLWNNDMAVRAIMRAWQDFKAAVKYWRIATEDEYQILQNGGSLPIKLDNNKIFGLGWSAGGINVFNNVLITDEVYEHASTEGGLLAYVKAGLSYTRGPLTPTYHTYGLDDYPTLPCIGLPDNPCLLNATEDDRINPLSSTVSDRLERANGRVDAGISFSGAVADLGIMKTLLPGNIPLADIHHRHDGILPYGKGKPFGLYGFGKNVRNVARFQKRLNPVYGGGTMEAYASTPCAFETDPDCSIPPITNFQLVTLSKYKKAGMIQLFGKYHYPQYKFGARYNNAIPFTGGGSDGVEPQIMFYVDAFFQKAIQDQAAVARESHNAKRKETLSINSNSEALSSFIYPNPSTTGQIQVEFNATTQSELQINITNLLGQNVLHTTQQATRGIQKIPINVSSLSNGLYILTVKGADQSISGKFIVNQ